MPTINDVEQKKIHIWVIEEKWSIQDFQKRGHYFIKLLFFLCFCCYILLRINELRQP